MASGSKQIKAGEAFLELTVRDGQFRRSLDRSIARLRALGASFKSIGSLGISGGGLAGLHRALTLIAGSTALGWPVKLAADMEVAEAAFTALTGSADKARDILRGLQEFSGRSSFSFDQLQIAARNMLNFGVAVNQILPLTEQLGAIAAGDADRLDRLAVAFGQTQAKGRLMAEEVRQMVNAGFNPLQEIARTTGRSMKQLLVDMEAGAVSADQVAAAFASVTGPGGRFNKILELISNTAVGQFNKLKAGIKIAVIALGNELLPAITGVLKYINNLIPSITAVVKANASWAKVIGAVVVGISALLAAIFSIGVTFQVAAFAATGFVGAISLLLNPITLISAGVIALGAAFVRFTNVGSAAFGFLSDKFGELLRVASETFGGIADALSGGDITAAANVLWAGLKLAWIQGTEELRRVWLDFKFFFLTNTTEMVFDALSIWNTFKSALFSIWSSLVTESRTIGEQIGHALTRSSDPELAADQDAAHQQALANIAAQGEAEQRRIKAGLAAAQAAIEANRATAEDARKKDHAAAVAAAIKEQEAAQRAFENARENARNTKFRGGDFKNKFEAALANFDIGQGGGGLGPRSTFSGKLAQQVFGAAGGDTEKQQLRELKRANKNLDDIKRKKVPLFFAEGF
jgi:tape measure domain-containing protein